MNFSFFVKLYLFTIPAFFLIDMLWLGVIAKNLYRPRIGHLMSDEVNWTAAFIFYFLYIMGILFFGVVPGLKDGNWQTALKLGAAFGFFTYMTYDMTNLATLKNWSITVVIIDVIWGTVLGATVASISFFIGQWLR